MGCDGAKRLSLIYVGPDEKEHRYSFQDLMARSNKLANALGPMVRKKETVLEYCFPQCPETLIFHIAVYKLGCIALPLLTL
jgi:acetyl-CoA synthetase